MNDINKVWTEKYRPKQMSDIVGGFKDEINNMLKEPQLMQHLLFHSRSPGVGKTTLARIISKQLEADVLEINSSDDRSIETVRTKIIAFARTKSSNPNTRRIVILDEADGLTGIAQKALINPMESYVHNVLFILTCNDITKIIDTLQSRCNIINFDNPDRGDIYEYLVKVCKQEKITFTEKGLFSIIKYNYPSIRNCIIAIQKTVMKKGVVTEDSYEIFNEQHEHIWNLVTKEKNYEVVKDFILSIDINIKQLNNYLWDKAVKTSNPKLIKITCMNEILMSRGADDKIVFITSLLEMVK
jgi:DNA polymerase III delta prime subunit